MSVATELETLQTNIGNAYTTIETKGGTVPANKNTDNLATAIDSIPSGGTPTPTPLDPAVVYEETRPSNWLDMPTDANVADNEIYFLLEVGNDRTDNYECQFISSLSAGSGTYDLEFGTVTDGAFVVDPTYSVMNCTQNQLINMSIPMTIFHTIGADKQVIMRAKTSSNFTRVLHQNMNVGAYVFKQLIVEIKGKGTSIDAFGVGNATGQYAALNLRYFTLLGANNITTYFTGMFQNCTSLISIPAIDSSRGTNFSQMFKYSYALIAIPQLDTSSGTNFNSMFANCYAITAIPLLDTSSGTNFSQMFLNCYSLLGIPQLDTQNGNNFNYMFSNCYSLLGVPELDTELGMDFSYMFGGSTALTTIPLIDTSSGTNFNGMFNGCRALTSIPLIDTSSGTNFSQMFASCVSLHTVPQLNTSSGTNFSQMFQYCYDLISIPLIDTSQGSNLSGMLQGCTSLKTIPLLDTSACTNCNTMFSGCSTLTSIPLIDISHSTNCSSMFSSCSSLSSIPQLDTSSNTFFSGMFDRCIALTSIPDLDTSSGTAFSNMFYGCTSLTYADLSGYDFSHVITQNNMSNFLAGAYLNGGGTIYLPPNNKFPAGGVWAVATFTMQSQNTIAAPIKWVISDDSGMLVLKGNATTIFGNYAYSYVYVPDSLYSTYAADTYWATLGTRLKKISEL